MDGHYVEPYAGGAEIALQLLFLEYAGFVHLNDKNAALVSFWRTLLDEPEWLCKRILDTPVTATVWKRQRSIYRQRCAASARQLGFAFFFLNRTNRSGILNGGMIGGYAQNSEWNIDARYNKRELIRRIQKIANYRTRITVNCEDACSFLAKLMPKLPERSLIYFDPPYFLKGGRLYDNHYKPADHAAIAALVQTAVPRPWIVSYDNVAEILALYASPRRAIYNLDYSAARRAAGSEVIFFSSDLLLPGELPLKMQLSYPAAA
jgi:DNA adenine methylase